MNPYEYLLSYLAEGAAGVAEAGEKVIPKAVAKKVGSQAGEKAAEKKAAAGTTETGSKVTVDPESLPQEDAKPGTEAIATTPVPQPSTAPNRLSDLWNKGITVPSLPSLEDLPEPGGIGMLLFLILLILFAFQKAGPNGETRLALLWDTVRGNATLAGETSLSSTPDMTVTSTNSAGTQFNNGGYPTLNLGNGKSATIPMNPGFVGG